MAEKERVLSLFEEQIQCPVCLDTFTDPKQLQCHHVYCRGCLVKLVERDEQGQLVLSCPNCRQITHVPDNGVRGLQPAFQTNNLLEIQDSLKKALTQDLLDSASDDEVFPVSTAPSRALSYCPEHVNEEIKLHCEDCQVFICIKCVVSGANHHCHSCKLLDSYRDDILSSLEPLNDQLSMSRNAAMQVDTQCAEIRGQQADMESCLDKTIGQLHEVLDMRKAELKSQLHRLVKSKLKCLQSQKGQIMKTHVQLEQFQSDIHEKLRLLRDDREIVAMKQSVTTQVCELASTFQPDTMKPLTSADMELTMPDNFASLCENFGTISSTKELQLDPSKCSVMNPACLESATVGTPVEIDVKALDHLGTPCLEMLTPLKFGIISEFKAVGEHGRSDGSLGHYEVVFMPTVKGQHQLLVTINSQHIVQSPFTVHVKSSVENLGDQISRIDGVSRPWGIVVNKKREIVVSESNKHCISVYTISGRKLRSFGSQGSREGQFKNPRGIALDDSGNIVVADHGNHRIQMFTEEGQFLKAVGTKGSGYLQFNGPNAITFNTHNQRFYVADCDGYVQILTSQFDYCSSFGGPSLPYTVGILSSKVQGICCSSTGQIYIAVTENDVILVFSAKGAFVKVFKKSGGRPLNRPSGIALDANNLYVSNQHGHDVTVLSASGQFVKTIGVNEKGQGELKYPRSIAVDEYGIVYVCDCNNDRICMY